MGLFKPFKFIEMGQKRTIKQLKCKDPMNTWGVCSGTFMERMELRAFKHEPLNSPCLTLNKLFSLPPPHPEDKTKKTEGWVWKNKEMRGGMISHGDNKQLRGRTSMIQKNRSPPIWLQEEACDRFMGPWARKSLLNQAKELELISEQSRALDAFNQKCVTISRYAV